MKNKLYPCLWFNGQAKEAATFYCGIFSHSKIVVDSPLVVQFEIEGTKIMGLNGGPMFKINPSVSLFVTSESEAETEKLYHKLLEGGSIMMPLDKYPWSEKYGWIADKFGMSWQLMTGNLSANAQKIVPAFLFTGKQYGKAAQAIQDYMAIFPDSETHVLELYKEGEGQPAGTLKFGQFSLMENIFSAMDGFGNHEFMFNEAVSLVAECDTQEQIDTYWNKLTTGGQESRCGWLKDKYGVSWQIVPAILGSLMAEPEKAKRVMDAVMKMKKLDIATLINA